MIKSGAIAVSLMAIAVDILFGYIESRLVSKGLRP